MSKLQDQKPVKWPKCEQPSDQGLTLRIVIIKFQPECLLDIDHYDFHPWYRAFHPPLLQHAMTLKEMNFRYKKFKTVTKMELCDRGGGMWHSRCTKNTFFRNYKANLKSGHLRLFKTSYIEQWTFLYKKTSLKTPYSGLMAANRWQEVEPTDHRTLQPTRHLCLGSS